MSNKTIFLGVAIGLAVVAAAMLPVEQGVKAFHTEAERARFAHMMQFPIDSSIIFPTAAACSGCHGYDENQYALVDFFGNDVNMHDDWRATMMANSAKDPFWRAKVSHEILLNPNHATAIETKCTSCHAPMGHYTAFVRGHETYTMADLLQDSTGLDGVSCGACHMISPNGLGESFSGKFNYDTTRVMYGPYDFPFVGPMADFVGYTPVYSPHVLDAGMCASCHTLVTDVISPVTGEFTGATFVEQATYHEWLNSRYGEDQDNVSCQGCHMPTLEEGVIISANYLFLDYRSPFALHELAGANSFMLKLMKQYRAQLGIDAEAEHFDATIAATLDMLQNRSLQTQFSWLGVAQDTARFRLDLTNLAGHKFPSGYPSRRLFVELVLTTATGDTLFHSGAFDANYELIHEDPVYEPHYDVITRPDQVQIYEMVAGDGVNDFTVVLEHASVMVKDNRLPPQGFRTNHGVYDTTRIVGQALLDPNFNRLPLAQEGSGADALYFHIPTGGYAGQVQATARVYYHALPPKWVNPIFVESSPAIDTFRAMFTSIDNFPVLVAERQLSGLEFPPVVGVNQPRPADLGRIFPNPVANDGRIQLQLPAGASLQQVEVFLANGQWVQTFRGPRSELVLPRRPGVYLVRVTTNQGSWTEKVVVM